MYDGDAALQCPPPAVLACSHGAGNFGRGGCFTAASSGSGGPAHGHVMPIRSTCRRVRTDSVHYDAPCGLMSRILSRPDALADPSRVAGGFCVGPVSTWFSLAVASRPISRGNRGVADSRVAQMRIALVLFCSDLAQAWLFVCFSPFCICPTPVDNKRYLVGCAHYARHGGRRQKAGAAPGVWVEPGITQDFLFLTTASSFRVLCCLCSGLRIKFLQREARSPVAPNADFRARRI